MELRARVRMGARVAGEGGLTERVGEQPRKLRVPEGHLVTLRVRVRVRVRIRVRVRVRVKG